MSLDEDNLTAVMIRDSFDLVSEKSDEHMLEGVRRMLVERIDHLLNHDFERLMGILYRIDVDEQKAKNALASSSELKPSEVLANLIIERLNEKAISRLRFREENEYNVGE